MFTSVVVMLMPKFTSIHGARYFSVGDAEIAASLSYYHITVEVNKVGEDLMSCVAG